MHYVIVRDDDTNALTPVECLEHLYRPFLDQGLPVNLATIPEVATNATQKDGRPEGFLAASARFQPHGVSGPRPNSFPSTATAAADARSVPLAANQELVDYLQHNPGYHVLQHGCHHHYLEFECNSRAEVARRLEQGTQRLVEAGFPRPQTFVAPYDKLSRAALCEVARRFRVLSTGWYELRRLPYSWWPRYALKKFQHRPHWQVSGTLLLSHPGCLLSCHRTLSTMMGAIFHYLHHQRLTVLVTHWWEYFRNGSPDEPFIAFLHETAAYLATHPDIKVISFADLAAGRYPLN